MVLSSSPFPFGQERDDCVWIFIGKKLNENTFGLFLRYQYYFFFSVGQVSLISYLVFMNKQTIKWIIFSINLCSQFFDSDTVVQKFLGIGK